MNLKDIIKTAVERHDIRAIGSIVEALRINPPTYKGRPMQFGYKGMSELFQRCAGIDEHEFECLMAEVDEQEAA